MWGGGALLSESRLRLLSQAAGLLREFEARGVPADVLVTDMDWHHTCYRRTYGNESEKSMDASHNWPCWSGFSFDKKSCPSRSTRRAAATRR